MVGAEHPQAAPPSRTSPSLHCLLPTGGPCRLAPPSPSPCLPSATINCFVACRRLCGGEERGCSVVRGRTGRGGVGFGGGGGVGVGFGAEPGSSTLESWCLCINNQVTEVSLSLFLSHGCSYVSISRWLCLPIRLFSNLNVFLSGQQPCEAASTLFITLLSHSVKTTKILDMKSLGQLFKTPPEFFQFPSVRGRWKEMLFSFPSRC